MTASSVRCSVDQQREIARHVVISPGTAKKHLASIQTKIDVRNRAAVVVWAYNHVTGPHDSRGNPFGDGAGMLHDWLSTAATDEDRAILQEMLDSTGAVVMGRTSYDKNEGEGGWGEGGPLGDVPCFVLTHTAPSRSHSPVFTFVTDGVVGAIEQAKQAAGGRVVHLHGATVMQQALQLGLVDEIRVHVVPVLLGAGTLLFGTLDSAIGLERTRVRVTPAATHLAFRVVQ
jgi:dihydrofolate reductase